MPKESLKDRIMKTKHSCGARTCIDLIMIISDRYETDFSTYIKAIQPKNELFWSFAL